MKEVVLRLFQDAHVRILLAEGMGRFIRDITEFDAKPDRYLFELETAALRAGTYYLYLVVNGEVVHLQELEVERNSTASPLPTEY